MKAARSKDEGDSSRNDSNKTRPSKRDRPHPDTAETDSESGGDFKKSGGDSKMKKKGKVKRPAQSKAARDDDEDAFDEVVDMTDDKTVDPSLKNHWNQQRSPIYSSATRLASMRAKTWVVTAVTDAAVWRINGLVHKTCMPFLRVSYRNVSSPDPEAVQDSKAFLPLFVFFPLVIHTKGEGIDGNHDVVMNWVLQSAARTCHACGVGCKEVPPTLCPEHDIFSGAEDSNISEDDKPKRGKGGKVVGVSYTYTDFATTKGRRYLELFWRTDKFRSFVVNGDAKTTQFWHSEPLRYLCSLFDTLKIRDITVKELLEAGIVKAYINEVEEAQRNIVPAASSAAAASSSFRSKAAAKGTAPRGGAARRGPSAAEAADAAAAAAGDVGEEEEDGGRTASPVFVEGMEEEEEDDDDAPIILQPSREEGSDEEEAAATTAARPRSRARKAAADAASAAPASSVAKLSSASAAAGANKAPAAAAGDHAAPKSRPAGTGSGGGGPPAFLVKLLSSVNESLQSFVRHGAAAAAGGEEEGGSGSDESERGEGGASIRPHRAAAPGPPSKASGPVPSSSSSSAAAAIKPPPLPLAVAGSLAQAVRKLNGLVDGVQRLQEDADRARRGRSSSSSQHGIGDSSSSSSSAAVAEVKYLALIQGMHSSKLSALQLELEQTRAEHARKIEALEAAVAMLSRFSGAGGAPMMQQHPGMVMMGQYPQPQFPMSQHQQQQFMHAMQFQQGQGLQPQQQSQQQQAPPQQQYHMPFPAPQQPHQQQQPGFVYGQQGLMPAAAPSGQQPQQQQQMTPEQQMQYVMQQQHFQQFLAAQQSAGMGSPPPAQPFSQGGGGGCGMGASAGGAPDPCSSAPHAPA